MATMPASPGGMLVAGLGILAQPVIVPSRFKARLYSLLPAIAMTLDNPGGDHIGFEAWLPNE